MSTPKVTKQNVLLAKTDSLAPSYKKGVVDYAKFFKDKQGAFLGERKTYTPRPETIDLPGERGNKLVVTTVEEKLDYLSESSADYINSLFSVEATNASGKVRVALVVDGVQMGNLSGLELLRLKNLLESSELQAMYTNIPVRSDAEEWELTDDAMYEGRTVFESPKQSGTKKSTTKVQYILQDPNVALLKDATAYVPQVSSRDTITELGDYTFQKFSGELSQTDKAFMLQRVGKLYTAVIEALKSANEVEAVQSDMTAAKFFGYINYGSIV